MVPAEPTSTALIAVFPDPFDIWLQGVNQEHLIDVVFDVGRPAEAWLTDGTFIQSATVVTESDIDYILDHPGVSEVGSDGRAGISDTLHRVSVLYDREYVPIGLTIRQGKIITTSIGLIADILDAGNNVLFIGPPGSGKSSLIRQACSYLSEESEKRVMIVDTSNEIAGPNSLPHESVGRSRRIMVDRRERQYEVMIEAVQNHTPGVIVIDEIGNRKEAQACCSIAERGVQIIASAHGKNLESVLKNAEINDILGRVVDVTVGDKRAEDAGGQKVQLQRRSQPAVNVVVEIVSFGNIRIHHNVIEAIDAVLSGDTLRPEARWIGENGQVEIRKEMTSDTRLKDALQKIL